MRPLPGASPRQLQVLLAFMGLAVTGLLVARTPVVFVLCVGVAALVVAPAMGIIMTLLGAAVPAARRNEAFGWMASANYVGSAAWTAGAGVIVVHSSHAAIVLTSLSLLAGAVIALKVGAAQSSETIVLPAPIALPEPRPERRPRSRRCTTGHRGRSRWPTRQLDAKGGNPMTKDFTCSFKDF